MFAYCSNNPIVCCDITGGYCSYNTMITDGGGNHQKYNSYIYFNNITQDEKKVMDAISENTNYGSIAKGYITSTSIAKINDYEVTSTTKICSTLKKTIVSSVIGSITSPIIALKTGIKSKTGTWALTLLIDVTLAMISDGLSDDDFGVGNYDQYVVNIEGCYEDYVVGTGNVMYFYQYVAYVAKKSNDHFVIISEDYQSWRS